MWAAHKDRMFLLQVNPELGNRTDGASAAAQRHYLGLALAGALRCAAVAGNRWCQSAARRNDDVCHRRRVHQVDVLGSRIPDASTPIELVHLVWRTCAASRGSDCYRMAGKFSNRRGTICGQLRGAATGADTGGILRIARHSGRRLGSTSAAVDSGSHVPTGHPDHLQPASELQHRNAIRDCRCAGQRMEPPGRDGHADRCRPGASGRDLELRDKKAIHATGRGGTGTAHGLRHLETADFDDVGVRMNLGNMFFDNGILHLANWLGNVIMPTIAAVFIIIAILQFSKGQEFSHSMYGALACLLVSGLTRAFETFASQAGWNNPDLYWVSIVTLIDWVANVILPVYAAAQVAAMALRLGIFSLVHPTSGWLRHFVTAALCLMVSGLLRLAEFFVLKGTGGVR